MLDKWMHGHHHHNLLWAVIAVGVDSFARVLFLHLIVCFWLLILTSMNNKMLLSIDGENLKCTWNYTLSTFLRDFWYSREYNKIAKKPKAKEISLILQLKMKQIMLLEKYF